MASFNDVVKLYVATFNRAPDSAGLEYWVYDSGLSIEGIAQSFFDQSETQTLYPAEISNTSFVNSVYHNLFNRDAEQAGLDYWVGELDNHRVSKQNFILAVINGAQNTLLGQDATILDNKQTVGLSFVMHGLDNVSLAYSLMSGVDDSTASVNSAALLIDQTAPLEALSLISGDVDGVALRGDIFDMSSNGRYAVFSGYATEYYDTDVTHSYMWDIFRKDMITGQIEVVSTEATGSFANGGTNASISDDGRYIVFESSASNFVSTDTNNATDIFLKDMDTGTVQLISQSATGTKGNDASLAGNISADGHYVLFVSDANNLVSGDTNSVYDTFVKDTITGDLTRISLSQAGEQGNAASYGGAISSDGRFVAFVSDASNLVTGDTNGLADVFLWDKQTGSISLVSTTSSGSIGIEANDNYAYQGCYDVSISADGRYVAFLADFANFHEGLSGGESRTMAVGDAYVKDTQTGTLIVASTTAQGAITTNGASDLSLSSNGTYVTFASISPYTSDGVNPNFFREIYVKNILTGAIELVSINNDNSRGYGESFDPIISGDGSYIAFDSWANNFVNVDTNGYSDAFRIANPLYDLG